MPGTACSGLDSTLLNIDLNLEAESTTKRSGRHPPVARARFTFRTILIVRRTNANGSKRLRDRLLPLVPLSRTTSAENSLFLPTAGVGCASRLAERRFLPALDARVRTDRPRGFRGTATFSRIQPFRCRGSQGRCRARLAPPASSSTGVPAHVARRSALSHDARGGHCYNLLPAPGEPEKAPFIRLPPTTHFIAPGGCSDMTHGKRSARPCGEPVHRGEYGNVICNCPVAARP